MVSQLKIAMMSTGIEWRKLLRSFSNVKTLGVEDGLVAYDWKTENFPWSCYLNCRSSHILEAAM